MSARLPVDETSSIGSDNDLLTNQRKAITTLVDACPIHEDFKPVIATMTQMKESEIRMPDQRAFQCTNERRYNSAISSGRRQYQEDVLFHQVFHNAQLGEFIETSLPSAVVEAFRAYTRLINQRLSHIKPEFPKPDEDASHCLGTTVSMALQIPQDKGTLIVVANVGNSLTLLATKETKAKNSEWVLQPLNWLHQVTDPNEQQRLQNEGGQLVYGFRENNWGPVVWQIASDCKLDGSDEKQVPELVRLKGKGLDLEVSRSIGDIELDKRGDYGSEPSITMVWVSDQKKCRLLQMTDGIVSKDASRLTVPQIQAVINQPDFRNKPRKWAKLLTLEIEQQRKNHDNSAVIVSRVGTTHITVSGVADEHRFHAQNENENENKMVHAYEAPGSFAHKVVDELPTVVIDYLKYSKQVAECLAQIYEHPFELKFYGGSTLTDALGQVITKQGQSIKVSRTASKIYKILTDQGKNNHERFSEAIELLTKQCECQYTWLPRFFKEKIYSAFSKRTQSTQQFYLALLTDMKKLQADIKPPSVCSEIPERASMNVQSQSRLKS